MGHPSIENVTPFAFEPLFLADEEGRPLFVPVIKATYEIGERGLRLADEQVPVNLEGRLYGKPEESSYRYEPECAFFKPATDVVLVGHAYAPQRGATETLVVFQVGALKKGVRVLGDRVFVKTIGMISMTRPIPFERIPLQWERAFGGWDRSHPDPKKQTFEPRNPVGIGFHLSGSTFQEGLPAPNLEDPAQPFRGWGHVVPPAGFGFTSPHWEPRARLAGTYDAKWEKERAPLLAKDFDRRYLNGAAPGLTAHGYLRGNEQVVVVGASPEGGLTFRLPGTAQMEVDVEREGQPDAGVPMNLDTVIVDTDVMCVSILWRGNLALRREPTELKSIRVRQAGAASLRQVG